MNSIASENAGLELGLSRLKRLAPQGFALGLHIRFASAHIMVQTYDPAWIELYTSRGYMMCDPLVSWGFATTGTARWSALDHPDPHNVLGQASAYGLNYGVAVSTGPTTSRSIGGFARKDREFTDEEIGLIEQTVILLHEESTPPDNLTQAQRHALRLIASGHRYAEAAALLGISESALKARLKSARDRLYARTTAEAIQRAQEYKLL
ncbi:helix-turn-helix transcriptional regulator [Ovoidimarina sediminis]|uniref:helix-turn-helix transcriptional regulator n=1 Tax=Ovoidimarina sediminis TaxID=3079856 RepID=UPI0029112D96|nr:autoinducer binding domain-containing protein [Rhodophyticola sp. MJ-SS7]MDU8946305.1 autoinducer binding domain-containing protein [Rhodophyticola sp. MJ-SS7]